MKTIGIVVVPVFAASAAGTLTATMTLTLSRINSSMSSGNVRFGLGPSLNKSNVLAIDITVFTHSLAKSVKEMLVGGLRFGAEERHACGCERLLCLLCACSRWPYGRAAEKRNKIAPPH